jgi:hypothetical protein
MGDWPTTWVGSLTMVGMWSGVGVVVLMFVCVTMVLICERCGLWGSPAPHSGKDG